MAAADYMSTPTNVLRMDEWFGVRGLFGLAAGIATYFGVGLFVQSETVFFTAIAIMWIVGGFPGKALLACSFGLLIGIVVVSATNPDVKFRDQEVVSKLGMWLFYSLVIGFVKLFIEVTIENKQRPKGNRELVKILPTATRLKLDNSIIPITMRPQNSNLNRPVNSMRRSVNQASKVAKNKPATPSLVQ